MHPELGPFFLTAAREEIAKSAPAKRSADEKPAIPTASAKPAPPATASEKDKEKAVPGVAFIANPYYQLRVVVWLKSVRPAPLACMHTERHRERER
jgi:hypothetical protein